MRRVLLISLAVALPLGVGASCFPAPLDETGYFCQVGSTFDCTGPQFVCHQSRCRRADTLDAGQDPGEDAGVDAGVVDAGWEPPPRNFIVNPDFEKGLTKPDSWRNDGTVGMFTFEETIVRSGRKAARLLAGNPGAFGLEPSSNPVTKPTAGVYCGQVYVQGAAGGPPLRLLIQERNAANVITIETKSAFVNPSTTWKKVLARHAWVGGTGVAMDMRLIMTVEAGDYVIVDDADLWRSPDGGCDVVPY